MIADSLQCITGLLGIKISNRQPHQLYPEIGKNRNIDTDADMQKQPAADKLNYRSAQESHQLGNNNNGDVRKVLCIDACIHNALGKKGKDQLN